MNAIPAESVARAVVSYDAVQSVGETIFWIEGRPEGDVLVRWRSDEGRRDVLPEGFRVASYAHEYGGGAYLASSRGIWYCNADDQRIYRYHDQGMPVPVTPEPGSPAALRYADLRLSAEGDTLICVRERHEAGAVHNELISLPADGSAEPRVIASGADFFMSPELIPDGNRLAWVSWNAPLMPWDGSQLWVADLAPDGALSAPTLVTGGPGDSVCQPQWGADGALYFVSDGPSGWWNLYRRLGYRVEPVISGAFEVAAAPWEFGYRTYALGERIIAILHEGSRHTLAVRTFNGELERVPLPYTSIKPYLATTGEGIVVVASSPVRLPTVILIGHGGEIRELTNGDPGVNPAVLSRPEEFSFPTRDGGQAHGLYYPPRVTSTEPQPLLVRAHPGPTANWPMRLDLHAQYFTSRGIAVADVDYRGSTGYGRAYRLQLRERWGDMDATDCADAARHLALTGRADPERMAIWGASAGGYTALRALATGVFVAGIARSTIVNPVTWSRASPKFQAHHAALLARTGQEDRAQRIDRPLLLIHGDADPVTPFDQVRSLARGLGAAAHLLVIHGAGHSFRRLADVRTVLAAEFDHLNSAFGCRRR